MKAMIFAAGLGTRLKPLTDHMPKALVPVAGKPILEHVIGKLKSSGFDEVVINVHHFADQIIDFLKAKDNFGIKIWISDETDELLDTGGGIQKAAPYFDEPFLVHNADILSNVDLKALYDFHRTSGNDATLLVSPRKTVRYLLFDEKNRLHTQNVRQHTDRTSELAQLRLGTSGQVIATQTKQNSPPFCIGGRGVFQFDRRSIRIGK